MEASEPPPTGRLSSRGAEATIRSVDWWGFPAVLKEREAKGYRPKPLDERLRKERTRTEVRLLVEARRVGVRTPLVYDVDLDKHRLILEELPGPTLRHLLEDPSVPPADLASAVRSFGETLGRLHAGGIAHGDLTSSNVLFPDGVGRPPALLDLSMGSRNPGVEELGIDLHLVEEDLKALSAHAVALVKEFHAGYRAAHPDGSKDVLARAKAIRARVRYA